MWGGVSGTWGVVGGLTWGARFINATGVARRAEASARQTSASSSDHQGALRRSHHSHCDPGATMPTVLGAAACATTTAAAPPTIQLEPA